MKSLDKLFPPIGAFAPPFNPTAYDNAMRDQFAFVIFPHVYNQMINLFSDDVEFYDKCEDIACATYDLADAMMEARSKK